MNSENIHYKWSKIFAGKRFGGKVFIQLNTLEQNELLEDILKLKESHHELDLELVRADGGIPEKDGIE